MVGIETSCQPYPGLVFEYCEHSSLDQYGLSLPADPYTRTRLLTNILGGLRYLHTFPTPIAHGDLNPSNILVDTSGRLKITLFSLSRLEANLPNIQEQELIKERMGTTRYLSPEMLGIQARPSTAADMWAFGCIVFWLYSKFAPYHNVHDEGELQATILQGVRPYSARSLFSNENRSGRFTWLTNGISDWAEKCWRGNDRPSASEFLNFVKDLPIDMDADNNAWLLEITNLSGSFSSPAVPIGGTTSIWRRSATFKGSQNALYVTIFWARTSYRRGLFRVLTEVTIKWSSPKNSAASLAVQQSMKHELKILTQLKHPNVCTLWGYEKGFLGVPNIPAIVTEFCINGSLKEYLASHAVELDTSKRVKLMENILKAVDYLHDGVPQGTIVHGNLNTVSVAVDKYGAPKLQNFEFAYQYMHNDRPALVSTPIHTPPLAPQPSRWHPPEMFVVTEDWPLVTRHTDLWAVGCLLLAVMSGQEPYSSTNVPAVFARIKGKETPYSKGACPNSEIWNLGERLWAINPLDRISAAKALQIIRLGL
ncbi:hypothetical protein FS749_012360 [Ceratobasidium sp. UAMH 11750]|nr:hypothetical protein FS749_012360 [Ceratobasidium sp. UAMH 11750]